MMRHSYNDISLLLSRFGEPVRLGHLFQRVAFVDYRLELARLNQLFEENQIRFHLPAS